MNQEEKSKIEKQREYNRRYYRRNRKKISERRRARYHSDPKRKRKIQQASLASYYRRTGKNRNKENYSVKVVNGIPLYSIQYASAVTGKSTDLLRQWEKEKIIPLTTYTDSRGWRLYTDHQLNLMSHAFRLLAKKEITKKQLAQYLHANWENKEKNNVGE